MFLMLALLRSSILGTNTFLKNKLRYLYFRVPDENKQLRSACTILHYKEQLVELTQTGPNDRTLS